MLNALLVNIKNVTSDSPVGQVDLETSVQVTHGPCDKETMINYYKQLKGGLYCIEKKRANNDFKGEMCTF